MSIKQSHRLNLASAAHEPQGSDAASEVAQETSATEAAPASKGAASGVKSSALANHKGKLAVGAAAMLGLAVFYKWREGRLAKDDPEEYARLRRLKAAVDTDKSQPPKGS